MSKTISAYANIIHGTF